jgi:hypothetical protein
VRWGDQTFWLSYRTVGITADSFMEQREMIRQKKEAEAAARNAKTASVPDAVAASVGSSN